MQLWKTHARYFQKTTSYFTELSNLTWTNFHLPHSYFQRTSTLQFNTWRYKKFNEISSCFGIYQRRLQGKLYRTNAEPCAKHFFQKHEKNMKPWFIHFSYTNKIFNNNTIRIILISKNKYPKWSSRENFLQGP